MQLHFSLIGWTHTLASVAAIIIGAMMIALPKGTATHKRNGDAYMITMVITNATALFIYTLGTFRVFHWMAVGTLGLVLAGYFAAHLRKPVQRWLHLHITCMVLSYYMLIGGLINEAFLRIDSLRQLASTGKFRMVNAAQFLVMLIFGVLLTYLLVTARRRQPIAHVMKSI